MKRLPAFPPPAAATGKPKGRYGRVYLSPEFLAWCERNTVKPAGIASCLLHTYALANPGRQELIVRSTDPNAAARIFRKGKAVV